MSGFWWVAGLLIAAALWFVLPTLLRGQPRGASSDAVNVALYRSQLRELEADLARGAIGQEHCREGKLDLERRLLEEVTGEVQHVARPRTTTSAFLIAALIPLGAVLLYLQLGNPQAISPDAEKSAVADNPMDIESMVEGLAARLEETPEDFQGWVTLARSYRVLERYTQASSAYARAHALQPDHADLLADYAEALALAGGGRFSKQSTHLLKHALKLEPQHMKALSLAGMAAFQATDFAQAVQYWRQLERLLPADSEDARVLQGYLAQARVHLGESAPSVTAASAAGAALKVRVELGAASGDRTRPDDTVFVFARAVDGPRMPLAIVRRQVKDLPFETLLDDSLAMNPVFKISDFTQVVVSARVSRSGSAIPQSGDLTGTSEAVKVSADTPRIVIKLDQTIP
ncbi:MAG: c-type cytochrome biogenesis protein CcmI [Burkholderiales bacterium]